MYEIITENLTYGNIILTVTFGLIAWLVKEQRRQCTIITKVKAFLIMKFANAKEVLE